VRVKEYALIVAGGSGNRMNTDTPKQFLKLGALPILCHTISKFYNYSTEVEVILVLPASEFSTWAELCAAFSFDVPHIVVEGGSTRTESVLNGLSAVNEDGLVAIHDGVRPFIEIETISKAYRVAETDGAAVTVVSPKDSIRKKTGSGSTAVDRNDFYLVQTPQTFQTKLIKAAYKDLGDKTFTDDAGVAEHTGVPIKLIEGSYRNIKITTPEDMLVAQALLQNQ
jgi:2-C-methyl-D-erythritol 4-phosphate cytidylyltransferase